MGKIQPPFTTRPLYTQLIWWRNITTRIPWRGDSSDKGCFVP